MPFLMQPELLLPARAPLRMIFWGGLLCMADLSFWQTTNGYGFRFDLLNDALGMGMIVWGVAGLKRIEIGDRYARLLAWVQVVAIVAFVQALGGHFLLPLPPPVSFAILLLGLVKVAAVIAFCVAMQWFCEAAWFPEVAQSWGVSKWLYVAYAITTSLLELAAFALLATGRSFSLNLGPARIVLLLVAAIYLLVTIQRTIRRLEGLSKPKF